MKKQQLPVLWEPSASRFALRKRAELLKEIRAFFEQRHVLEVETPLLCQHTVTDPYLSSFVCTYHQDKTRSQPYYLQTSPEYAMKRLLAAGSGSIFQICKAFRNGGEYGRHHNPEFTLLEWYRVGYDHHQLMTELDALLQLLLRAPPAHAKPYQTIYQQFLKIDPLATSVAELMAVAQENQVILNFDSASLDRTDWLQLLFSHCIEPQLDPTQPLFVYDFPTEQAALARANAADPRVAGRFELYYQGHELANGFYELNHPAEQRARFIKDQKRRRRLGLPIPVIDERLLAALVHMPECAGVAVGVDRLLMIAMQAPSIQEVLSFDLQRA